jgi:hypothetical protein
MLSIGQPTSEKSKSSMKSSIKPWVVQTKTVVCIKATKAKHRIHETEIIIHDKDSDLSNVFRAIAFQSAEGGKIWIGPKMDFYIEMDSKIIGGVMMKGGFINWSEGFPLQDAKGNLDSEIHEFEKRFYNSRTFRAQMASGSPAITNVRDALDDFFLTRRTASQPVMANITSAKIENTSIKIELENPLSKGKASIWVDLKTWKIIKAIQNGKRIKLNNGERVN